MATKVTSGEDPFRAKYDWDQWSDGNIWLIERVKDYTCSDKMFQVAVAKYAARKNLGFRTSKHPRGVVIQFTQKAPPAKGGKKLRRK